MIQLLLAQSSVSDVKAHYSNLIFMGCFFLVILIVAILWLKRNT